MTLEAKCPGCAAPFKETAAFCAGCGRKRALVDTEGVGFSIRFYIALLASQVVTMAAIRLGAAVFTAVALDTAAMALITLVTAGVHRRLVIPAYQRAGFGPLGYLSILVAAPAVALVIGGYVHGLAHAFGLPTRNEIEPLRGHGVTGLLGLIAVAPPIFEELAFRGLIYGALAKSLRRSEAYLISSFAFAMLHLSVPALLTHLPLGLYFCWLRERSGSMYPSMFAHFSHNLGVVIVELNGWI